jgi:hypothetical protein
VSDKKLSLSFFLFPFVFVYFCGANVVLRRVIMSEVLEERATKEVVDRDVAIGTLRNELSRIETASKELQDEVWSLLGSKRLGGVKEQDRVFEQSS